MQELILAISPQEIYVLKFTIIGLALTFWTYMICSAIKHHRRAARDFREYEAEQEELRELYQRRQQFIENNPPELNAEMTHFRVFGNGLDEPFYYAYSYDNDYLKPKRKKDHPLTKIFKDEMPVHEPCSSCKCGYAPGFGVSPCKQST